MSKTKIFVIFALLIGGVQLLSCSNPNENEDDSSSSARGFSSSGDSGISSSSSSSSIAAYSYCVFETDRMCLNGPVVSCPPGGVLSNDCPFNTSGGTSSSTEGEASSNSEGGTSSSAEGEASSSSVGGASSSSVWGASSSSVAQSSSSVAALPEYAFCVYSENRECYTGPYIFCPGRGELSNACPYGSFTDSRNNKEYKTVVIGTQTWMAENLNYEPSSAAGLHKCYAEGYGYDTWLKPDADAAKIKANCDKYGRLYDWITAMNLSKTCAASSCESQVQSKHQGVCPSGWHIPSRDEWNVLKKYVFDILWENYEDEDFGWDVGTKLKAKSGWKAHSEPGYGNGVDTYGFNAIGSGYCYSCESATLNAAEGSYAGIGGKYGDGEGEIARWWTATGSSNQSQLGYAWRFTMSYNSNTLIEKTEDKSDLYSIRCVKN